MTQNTDVTAARDQLLADFNKVVSDTDVLLRSLVGVGGEKARAVRESVEMNLASTRERMRQLQASATEKTVPPRAPPMSTCTRARGPQSASLPPRG